MATAALARRFAGAFGAEELAWYLALVHDVGKCTHKWQEGLARAEQHTGPVGIPHKHAGTLLAERAGLGQFAKVVFGHHGGLPDTPTLKKELQLAEGPLEPDVREAIERMSDLLPEIQTAPPIPWPSWLQDALDADEYAGDLLIRMVFSAVVDADYLDTEAHFQGRARADHPVSAASLMERFEQERQKLLTDVRETPVNRIRQHVYELALRAAEGPLGVYRLFAPTGSGKTLAAGGFALRHARVHGLRRVIVAVPYLSITEQNAAVYRQLLDVPGEPAIVLEHHSGIDLDTAPASRWQRLAAENWDAPFVVTTTVRLFESLFDHRPAVMRRLHRLAGSVIVFDEVQALPDQLLDPILSVLRTLTERFGVTVLLASATQPDFESIPAFDGLAIHDVIEDPARLAADLDRVRYRWWVDPEPTMDDVTAEAAAQRQALIICNTTSDAQAMHRLLQAHRDPGLGPVLHLSTRMTSRHRRQTLDEVHARLSAGEPISVVSTQLVEAGVDLDFPIVYRAFAPADSLLQAAGRANRSGSLPSGTIVIFDLADGNRHASCLYGLRLGVTTRLFREEGRSLTDLDALAAYYRECTALAGGSKEAHAIQRARCAGDFPKVTKHFRMIKERTVPVVVPPVQEGERLRVDAILHQLRRSPTRSAALIRELRPHMATLPLGTASRVEELTQPVVGDLVEWLGDYHELRGIELADTKGYVF